MIAISLSNGNKRIRRFMKKILILTGFYVCIFFSSFSQKESVEFFIQDKNQKPIENVYVLIAEEPITISDRIGSIKIPSNSKIRLQHISYETKEIDTKNIDSKILVMSVRVNQLEEISVLPSSVFKDIFTECLKRMKDNYPVGHIQYLDVNHYSTSNNEVVTALDGLLKINIKSYKDFNYNNEIFIDKQTKLRRTYFEDKQSFERNYFISSAEVFHYLDFNSFSFLTKVKAYDYFLQNKSSQEYEIIFSPKEKTEFAYSGKIIIDKKDYGIRLIEIELTDSDNNVRTTVINNFKAVDKYNITAEKIQLYFQKKADKYYLESAFYIASMLQLKTSKIEHPKSFFTQTILLNNDKVNFENDREISLSDLSFIEKKSTQKDKSLNDTERKVKEKVEKYVKENEDNE